MGQVPAVFGTMPLKRPGNAYSPRYSQNQHVRTTPTKQATSMGIPDVTLQQIGNSPTKRTGLNHATPPADTQGNAQNTRRDPRSDS
jgi:hypothetical protein